jgi:hypothetical protein
MKTPASADPFSSKVQECIDAGISNQELADEFKVSMSTIDRWKERKSYPVESVRTVIIRRMDSLLAGRSDTK